MQVDGEVGVKTRDSRAEAMVPAPNWSSSTGLFFPLWATLYDEFMKRYLRVFTAAVSEFERKQQHVEY